MYYDNIIKFIAVISLILGAVECFAGYKTMNAMLTIWGFLIGAVLGVIAGAEAMSAALGIGCILIFGTGLAALAFVFRKAGIFIYAAFLIMTAAYIVTRSMPISALSAAAGILAVLYEKPAVIISSSLFGAGVILSSAYLVVNIDTKVSPVITMILWILLALAGMACQYITAPAVIHRGRTAEKYVNRHMPTYSERKYPGMQRAYRNFCIKCGCRMNETGGKCPRCGFSF